MENDWLTKTVDLFDDEDPDQTPEERWRDAFKKFDKDANNSIEQDELYMVLRELGHKVRTQS